MDCNDNNTDLGNTKNEDSISSSVNQDKDQDSFLDSIESLGVRQKNSNTDYFQGQKNDLLTISINDYPVEELSIRTTGKMEELNSIISAIEKKSYLPADIKLNNTFKIDYLKELNRPQLEAVATLIGPVLVIAGAGSGKTRVIVHRVAYMIENGINPGEILLLTFTRKAANEMLGRVQKLLNDNSVQKVYSGTFHAFSNYILRKYSGMLNIPANFTIIDEEDSADTIDLIRSELKFEKKEKAFPRKNRIQEIISSSRNRNITIREVVENDFTGLLEFIPQIELISMGYERFKRASGIFDYDDLMDVLRDSLRDNSVFRKKLQDTFKYIMVDEYQDTNIIQKEIVELLSEQSRNVLVVGDDIQSIYSFRGANYENILRFPQKYPDCKVIKIEENYRSNQKILDFTNEIILNAKIGYKKQLFSKISNGTVPQIRKLYDQEAEAQYVVDRILEYREQSIALNQIAVLVRAFWHARYIEVELNKRNIPYIVVGGIRFNERKHVKDIISYLKIIQNPYDAVAWHRILKYLPGIGPITVKKLIEKILSQKGIDPEEFSTNKYANALESLLSMLDKVKGKESPIPEKIEIIKEYYTPILQAKEDDFKVRLLDINVLIDLSSKYSSIETFLTDFALDPPSKNFGTSTVPLIDETEDKPLTISTIHSAKGLEWYGVFIPHALDGLIPSIRALNTIEEIEEERRLFYVACSRAKEDLIITMPSYVNTYNAFLSYPCRFLVEINKDKFLYK